MASDLKTRMRICTTLPKEIYSLLKKHSTETMIPISKIIESAIVEYLKIDRVARS